MNTSRNAQNPVNDMYYCRSDARDHRRWMSYLPAEWTGMVDVPLYFEHYREYEMSSERTLGFDADDSPCFTSHRFILTRLATDDDEEFYESISYAEEMFAWRMRDGRWLVFRQTSADNCRQVRGFHAFSPTMPR